ncbi:MAG: hypothetical protein COA78_14345 [Blastopirellula sp.]|nr:MAG: hypothetical protein COA78_14345 [Blastopirellula sp.]
MKQKIGQQGEVAIMKIAALPTDIETKSVERSKSGAFIISHSESGHHHVIPDGEVMERTSDVPAGMRILYAILDNPSSLRQEADHAHENFDLESGVYEFRISREYDPFAEQARIVAD